MEQIGCPDCSFASAHGRIQLGVLQKRVAYLPLQRLQNLFLPLEQIINLLQSLFLLFQLPTKLIPRTTQTINLELLMFIIIIMMMGLVYFIYYVLIGKIPTIIFTMITLLLGLVLTTAVDVLVLDCYVLFLFLFLFLLLILS